ncbi:MAG: hypothetical protein NTU98_14520 [Bacteroidetes bacterium]|nr:hypothetical protein [Bacteroidota bacterium]
MNDENLHITPDPEKGFPAPEIPADEAWNNMAGLLDVELPVSQPDPSASPKPSKPGSGGILGGSSHIWNIILIVVGVAGLLTWSILHFTSKPQTAINRNDTINVIKKIAVTDSLKSVHQNNPSSHEKTSSYEKIEFSETKLNLPARQSVSNSFVQSTAFAQSADITKKEEHSAPKTTAVTDNPSAAVPSQPGTGKTVPMGKIINEQTPVIPDTLWSKAANSKSQNEPPAPRSVPDKSSGQPVSDLKSDLTPATDVKPADTKGNRKKDKSGSSPRLSENMNWQTGLHGNAGMVVQKGRNPNLFYGGMVTAGLWHKKLKAGIETGIGWQAFNDYGSVSNTVRVSDSIAGDSLHTVTYTNSTRTSGHKYLYQYLQVPLFISKQVVSNRKFSLDVKTGPVVGFMISERTVSDYSSDPVSGEVMDTVYNDYARLKTSWQWQLMVQFRWNLNERISLEVSPSGTYYLNNLYERDNRPAGTPFGISINAGLIYKFK